MIRVFTDGACKKNGKVDSKASWAVWFPENAKLSASSLLDKDDIHTNNRAELLAIWNAVKITQENFPAKETSLTILTDSEYSLNCLTKWVPSWIARGWKTSQGTEVQHKDIIEPLVSKLSLFKSYKFTHVMAHTGKDDDNSKNNAIVDRMANEAINPDSIIPEIKSSSEKPFPDFPVGLMTSSVHENKIVDWIKENVSKIDDVDLLFALSRTLKKKGYELRKTNLHRDKVYSLHAHNIIHEK